MEQPDIMTINNSSELYLFFNEPTPTYGIIVTDNIKINFDFTSQYKKVLTSSVNNIKITETIHY